MKRLILLAFLLSITSFAQADKPADGFRFVEEDCRLMLYDGEKPVYGYVFKDTTMPWVPESEHRKWRSCYIHPVYGIDGEVLTEDFPKDHYHHHGIFWSWPYMMIDGKTYDSWEYKNVKPRMLEWVERKTDGQKSATLTVREGMFPTEGDKEKSILSITTKVVTYAADETSRAIDLELTLAAVDRPITLQGRGGKSYGGLTIRFDGYPDRDSNVRTPKGESPFGDGQGLVAKGDLYNTPLPWVDFTRQFPGMDHRSGAALFVSKSHPDYPPTWLTRCYGPQCVGWPGVKPATIEPDHPVVLRYRVYIHKTELSVDELDAKYKAYVQSEKDE